MSLNTVLDKISKNNIALGKLGAELLKAPISLNNLEASLKIRQIVGRVRLSGLNTLFLGIVIKNELNIIRNLIRILLLFQLILIVIIAIK